MVEGVFKSADVLIFSDLNHSHSASDFRDLFSPKKLQILARNNVTDIHVEFLTNQQPLFDSLARGELKRDEFIKRMLETGRNTFLTPDEDKRLTGDVADAIIAASRLDPPIRFHAQQISDTEGQKAQTGELVLLQTQTAQQGRDIIAAFSDRFAGSDSKGQPDRDFLFSKNILDALTDIYLKLDIRSIEVRFKGRVPELELGQFILDLQDNQLAHAGLRLQEMKLAGKFRTDNDVLLADAVAERVDPTHRAVVVHGAAHGAESRESDLDEQLAMRGLSSQRVNIVYKKSDTGFQGRDYADPSEMNYHPLKDRLESKDRNKDGTINGFEQARPPTLFFSAERG